MLRTIKKLFGSNKKVNYAELIKKGGIILDVRTAGEFAHGHIKGSINIPLVFLEGRMAEFKDKNTPIITCCASGMRSASAKRILQSHGFTEVHNGGGWVALDQKLKNQGTALL